MARYTHDVATQINGDGSEVQRAGNTGQKPFKALAAALLERSWLDVTGSAIVTRTERKRAWRWFLSSSNQPFSFLWACDILEITPARVRQIVKRQALK